MKIEQWLQITRRMSRSSIWSKRWC